MTTIDGTKQLPTRILTLPMSALSRGLQAGMRLQQGIAEMAIKGDEFFAPFCDQPEEQPEWARFDEDDTPVIAIPPDPKPTDPKPAPAKAASAKAEAPATKAAAKKAPAKKAPARKPAEPATASAAALDAEPPAASSGRFALYSTAPAELAEQQAPAPAKSPKTAAPEIVEYLEYDQLTLAQLRAKLRGLGADELQELVDYERADRNRAPFVTMIDNRISSQTKKSGASS